MKQHRGERQRGFTFLEFIAVVTIIALLSGIGAIYYGRMLEESRRVGVEILAHRFTAAVALVHAQWLISGGANKAGSRPVDVDGLTVYVNERGWAANTSGRSTGMNSQTADECRQIWQVLLQNPAPITVERSTGERQAEGKTKGSRRYHVSQVDGRICRYELVTTAPGTHYFEYNVGTGQVLINVPPLG